MKKLFKIALYIVASLLILLICGVAYINWYINHNKKQLIATLQEQYRESFYGDFLIEDLKPDVWSHFPNVSFALKNVALRDSLWYLHRKDLLFAEEIYASVDLKPLLKKQIKINELTFKNGSFHMFKDEKEYSNIYILKRKETAKSKSGKSPFVTRFKIENFKFSFENTTRFKLFQIEIKKFNGETYQSNDTQKIYANATLYFKNFVFNTQKGSFLKDKTLSGNLSINYNTLTQVLSLPTQDLHIDKEKIQLRAAFDFSGKPSVFRVDIVSPRLDFNEAKNWLTPSIARNFKSISMDKRIDVRAIIQGEMKYRAIPLVEVSWKVANTTVGTPAGDFTNSSFTGEFNNGKRFDSLRNDLNSSINLFNVQSTYKSIPFNSDTCIVYNIIEPRVYCKIRSQFPVNKLNMLMENSAFKFGAGQARLNILFNGSLNLEDTVSSSIWGQLQLDNTQFEYLPRKLQFKDCKALLDFKDKDIYVRNLSLHSQYSTLKIDATARNFLSLYFKSPDKLQVVANVSSDKINLNEFKVFLQQRGGEAKHAGAKKTLNISDRLDKALDALSARLKLDVANVVYNHFEAQQIRADILLKNNGLDVNNVYLRHAGGTIMLNASVLQAANGESQIGINAKVDKVKVDKLFYAFDNFGQKTFNSENIAGDISLETDLKGSLDKNGNIIPKSLLGTLKFDLDNAELNNFKPIQRLGRFVFKRKKLEHITFKKVNNVLTIRKDMIYIPPMYINTNILDVNIQGVYSLTNNSDIGITIPLFSFKKEDLGDGVGERTTKGIMLNVRGLDNEEGEMEFSWDNKKEGGRKYMP